MSLFNNFVYNMITLLDYSTINEKSEYVYFKNIIYYLNFERASTKKNVSALSSGNKVISSDNQKL